MPEEIYGDRYQFLPRHDLLTFEEIVRLVSLFTRLGVSKVRVTGGEPLVRKDVETLIGMLSKLKGVKDLTLTTNGFLLAEKAKALKDAGLHRITVSLDSLDDGVFRRMSGRSFGPEKVLAGIEQAVAVGFSPVKVNVVVIRGVNDQTVLEVARYFKGSGISVRFIEYMDVGTLNGWRMEQVVPGSELVAMIHREMPLEPIDPSYRGEVASRYRYLDGDGEIGIITSVTRPFCVDCTRMRLSPDGKLYTCLFSGSGHDISGLMRRGASDSELADLIANLWKVRSDRYSEERTSETATRPKVEMYQIGG